MAYLFFIDSVAASAPLFVSTTSPKGRAKAYLGIRLFFAFRHPRGLWRAYAEQKPTLPAGATRWPRGLPAAQDDRQSGGVVPASEEITVVFIDGVQYAILDGEVYLVVECE